MPDEVADDRDDHEDRDEYPRQATRGLQHRPQPELSNEPPPLDDGFGCAAGADVCTGAGLGAGVATGAGAGRGAGAGALTTG